MISKDDLEKLEELRSLLFDGIETALEFSGPSKNYDGAIEIHFPGYFYEEGTNPHDRYGITIHCSVLGTYRHYDFSGRTLSECLDYAIQEVEKWVREEEKLQDEFKSWYEASNIDFTDLEKKIDEDLENVIDVDDYSI